jgi:hypothetical protein
MASTSGKGEQLWLSLAALGEFDGPLELAVNEMLIR